MFLVAGGYAQQSYNLLSTEVKVADSGNWKTAGELPSSITALVATSLNGDIFLTGKGKHQLKKIGEFCHMAKIRDRILKS